MRAHLTFLWNRETAKKVASNFIYISKGKRRFSKVHAPNKNTQLSSKNFKISISVFSKKNHFLLFYFFVKIIIERLFAFTFGKNNMFSNVEIQEWFKKLIKTTRAKKNENLKIKVF